MLYLIMLIPDLCILSDFVTRKTPLSLLNNLNNIVYGHVREFVALFVICLIIYLIGLHLYSIDILLLFPWLLIVFHLLQICVLFCYKRDFMQSLSDKNQSYVIEAFNSTSRYLNDLLNMHNRYFEQMVSQIYSQLSSSYIKQISYNIKALLLVLDLSITSGIISSKFITRIIFF